MTTPSASQIKRFSSLKTSMNRLELLSSELQYAEEVFGVDLPNFVVPFVTELYIEYVGELFNQSIFLQDINLLRSERTRELFRIQE